MFYPGVMLVVLYAIVNNGQVLFKKSVLAAFLLYLVLLLFDIANHFNNVEEVHLKPFGIFTFAFPFFLSALIVELILSNQNDKNRLFFGKMVFFIFILNSLFGTISELLSPGVTRNFFLREETSFYITFSFGGIYGLPFVIAAFIAIKSKFTLPNIFFMGIMIAAIVLAGFLTSLLITTFLVIAALLVRYKVKNLSLVMFFLLIFVFVLYSNLDFVIDLLPQLPNQSYSNKVKDLVELSQSGAQTSSFMNIRANVYGASYDAILKHILIGSGSWNDVGKHSFWLDRVGFIGIVGTFFFALPMYLTYTRSILICPVEYRKFYRIIFLLLAALLFLNPFYFVDFWLIIFVYLPLVILYLSHVAKGRKATATGQ